MKRISRNVSIVLRSERLIAQRQLAVFRRQTGLMAAAGVVAGIGLLMLNVAAFLMLAIVMSQHMAALVVGVVNVVLALVLMSLAGKSSAEQDTAPVAEVRDMALEDIEAELNIVAAEAKATTEALRRMARDPFGTIAPGIVGDIAKAVLKSARK